MLGVLTFVEDPDLSVSAARALAQHLPPWPMVARNMVAYGLDITGNMGAGRVRMLYGYP